LELRLNRQFISVKISSSLPRATRFFWTLLVPLLLCGWASSGWAQQKPADPQSGTLDQRLRDIEQRQEALEKRQSELYIQSIDGSGQVKAFLGEKISLGGYFESGILSISGPDTERQVSNNSNTLGLNLTAEFTGNIKFVSQIMTGLTNSMQNPHNNPNVTPSRRQFGALAIGSLVAQGYVEFSRSQAFNIQTGLGYVPFGQAFQLREPVLFRRRGGPQLITSTSSNGIGLAFPLWMGVHIHGEAPSQEGYWGYNLYTFAPFVNSKTLGQGGRLWWAPSETLKVGLSVQNSGEQTSNSYTSHGVDLDLRSERLGLIAEYAKTSLNSGQPSPVSYYAEPYLKFSDGKFILYGVVDYLDSPSQMTGSVADPFRKWQVGGGLNWLPISTTRFRLGFLMNQYKGETALMNDLNRDYASLDFSTGIAF
jgi:hypothetical protein